MEQIIHIYDPYFVSTEAFGIKIENNIKDIISKVDATIIVTAHDEFKKLDILLIQRNETSYTDRHKRNY